MTRAPSRAKASPWKRARGTRSLLQRSTPTGYLEFRADKVGEDTTLAQVIRMVEDAGGSKAPIARLADKIAGVFVPVVMSIAAVTFIVWMIAGYGRGILTESSPFPCW